MRRLLIAGLIAASLLRPALADGLSGYCGEVPPVANETVRAAIADRVNAIAQTVGTDQFGYEIELEKSEIFSTYPDPEVSRSQAYFAYVVCNLIMQDEVLSTTEKVDEWLDVHELILPREPIDARLSRVVADANERLYATRNNDIDLQARRSAIDMLRLIASEDPPDDYYWVASDILMEYIRFNIDDRKRLGPGIVEDRGTFHSADIIAALKALQKIREASNGRVQISLIGLNFDKINFVEPSGLDLSFFHLNYSTFNGAFLSACICRYTNFAFATFDNAAIWNADFTGANFHKSNLYNSKWDSVIFAESNIEEAIDHRVQRMNAPRGLNDDQVNLFR